MPYRSHKQTGRLSGRNQGGRKLDAAENWAGDRNTLMCKLKELSLHQ